ncbi:MAG: hypothetical protein JWM02_3196 [Frankiales bacterium]|nr:hypothetical protein [Frankiales bacterium]
MLVHRVVFALARLAGLVSRRAGRGAGRTLPGRLALLLRRDSLERLARGRSVVLVSGTNGKTTTTRLLTAALGFAGPVVSNSSGSNLERGLVSALLDAEAGVSAVLEVDEVVLPTAMSSCRPVVVVLLNLSRDQLDRTSEVTFHVKRWREALTLYGGTVVANADDPLVATAVRGARPTEHDVVWVAAGQPWRGDLALCPSCGGAWEELVEPWSCAHCSARRPDPHWALDGGELVAREGSRWSLALALPGRANAANAGMAVAAACVLDVPAEVSVELARSVTDVEGRYLSSRQGDHDLRLLLAKNPAGWLEALSEITSGPAPVVIALNARSADGTDPSWLWDVPFERLAGRRVVVTGERATDLAVRLHYAEVAHEVHPDLRACVQALPPGACDVVANYTAFVQARASLARGLS